MIEGYSKDRYGIVKQDNPAPFEYGEDYYNIIHGRGELNTRMAHLRYGYMIGVLGVVPHSLLDVGYGDGSFLSVCKEKIQFCYANDIYKKYIPEVVLNKCCLVEDITNTYYDVICFHDSLEHFPSIDFLKYMQCSAFYITVPDYKNMGDFQFANWKHRKPDEHIFHFSKDSLENLFFDMGYELLDSSHIEDVIRGGHDNILSLIFGQI